MLYDTFSILSFIPLAGIIVIAILGLKLKNVYKWIWLTYSPFVIWIFTLIFFDKLESSGGLYFALFYTIYIFLMPVYYIVLAAVFYKIKRPIK